MSDHTPGHVECPGCEANRAAAISKKPARVTCYQVGSPLENVPAAARMFANYVFKPATRQPHGNLRPGGRQGAALLVFADQSQQELQLLRCDAALVAGPVGLHAGKDGCDKIVSSHSITPPEVPIVSAKIACPACRAVIEPGAQICPACGLQLVSHAVPVIPAKKKSSFLPGLIIAGLLLAALLSYEKNRDAEAAAHQQASMQSLLDSGQVGTPESFEQRCGAPRATHAVKRGTELHYTVDAKDYYVTFEGRPQPAFELGQISGAHAYRIGADPIHAMQTIGCK